MRDLKIAYFICVFFDIPRVLQYTYFMKEENLTTFTKILNFIVMIGIVHVSSKYSYIRLLVAFAITKRTILFVSMCVSLVLCLFSMFFS
jgi:hypothetical protein